MRHITFKKLAVQINVILAASCLPLVAKSAPLDISNKPLAGVAISYAPNLVLALSVEFPTAGPAYTTVGNPHPNRTNDGGMRITLKDHFNREYRGYLDPKKCYQYTGKGGHFTPVAFSTTVGGKMGLCPYPNAYSASMLNFLSASALDIFRQTLTGGNRAYGNGTNPSNYEQGDTLTQTFVRRAQPGWSKDPSGDPNKDTLQHSTMRERGIDLAGATEEQLNALFPKSLQKTFEDIKLNKRGRDSRGIPNEAGLRALPDVSDSYRKFPTGKESVVGKDVFYKDQWIYFNNTGFGGFAYRWVSNGRREFPAYIPDMVFDPIVVEVCKEGYRANEKCQEYNGNYKPEGLLQQYAHQGMRVAVMGYINDSTDKSGYGNAAVLRGRMKTLNKSETVDGIVYGQEWNPKTGQFYVNPDTTDARTSSVSNSGVINYVNKFGDKSGYKTYDIGSDLYYLALRYLRGGANGNFGSMAISKNRAYYTRTKLTEVEKDGFPVIYDWEDPILRGLGRSVKEAANSPEAQCRANSILYIGDTNTWEDGDDLPNFDRKNFDNIKTADYLKALLQYQGLNPSTWNRNRGALNSPSGMAGLAFWARNNDIRADIPGEQYGDNFLIDVVERGRYKGQSNTYWLAAKYGGFDRSKAVDYTYNGITYKVPANDTDEQRKGWTNDAPGRVSIPDFFNEKDPTIANGRGPSLTDKTLAPQGRGIPKNFGVGNDPDSMEKSLENAFSTVGKFDAPSQGGLGFTTIVGNVDFQNEVLALKTSFNITARPLNLSGDLTLSRITFDFQKSVLGAKDVWSANTKLSNAYLGSGNAWEGRRVYTRDGGSFRLLKEVALPGSNADSLRSFILGSQKDEGNLWRSRNALLGTVVNSTPVSILKPEKADLGGCAFDAAALNRESHYAFAANDGMFHILNSSGDEKLAYMPSTALPKLRAYADMNAEHQFINDGTPVYADVCFGTAAKSVVIGTTGRGGAAVYAVDATNLSAADADKILWEFAASDDDDLGLTIGKVSVSKNRSGKPIAVFSSGFNNAGEKGYLYVLDITNQDNWVLNNNYWKIPLGSQSTQGVGRPFVYDLNKDGVADYIYVGDYNGKLWRVDHGTDGKWAVANSGNPMFTPKPTEAAPITGAPFVDDVDGKIYVVFATGQFLNEDASNPATQNYAYGLIDDGSASTIAPDALLKQQVKLNDRHDFLEGTRTLWQLTDNKFDEKVHKGWQLSLRKGDTVSGDSVIRGGEVADFTAVNKTDEALGGANVCLPSGSTSFYSINLKTGGAYEDALYDTNGDNEVNNDDKRGGVYTAHGQVNANLAGTDGKIGDKDAHVKGGFSDSNSVVGLGKTFGKKAGISVFIRTTHREVPL